MTNIERFDEIMGAVADKELNILVGNGFSIAQNSKFENLSILDSSGILKDPILQKLYEYLRCHSVESLMFVIELMTELCTSLQEPAKVQLLSELELKRNELAMKFLGTFKELHPHDYTSVKEIIEPSRKLLLPFQHIFTTNYDLLLYWVFQTLPDITDGFNSIGNEYVFTGMYGGAKRRLWFLHGGLHLFNQGRTKCTSDGQYLLSKIIEKMKQEGVLPMLILGGTSETKQLQIKDSTYLNLAFQAFRTIQGFLVVLGSSFDRNDAHVWSCIFNNSRLDSIFVGIYKPEEPRGKQTIERVQELVKNTRFENSLKFFNVEELKLWSNEQSVPKAA